MLAFIECLIVINDFFVFTEPLDMFYTQVHNCYGCGTSCINTYSIIINVTESQIRMSCCFGEIVS